MIELPLSPTLDYPDLLARCEGDLSMLSRLLAKFEEKSQTTLTQLTHNLKSHNAAETTRLAHGLKGTAANLSARKLSALAGQIESLGREGDLSRAETFLTELTDEMNSLHEVIRRLPGVPAMPSATASAVPPNSPAVPASCLTPRSTPCAS